MRHRILLSASFAYLAVSNWIWISRDTRPPFWDMAFHANAALRIYDAFSFSGLKAVAVLPHLTGYYPPVYHAAIAAIWSVFGKSVAIARLGNLIPVAILLLSTYGVGRAVLSGLAAATAAMLVSFYPGMVWLSRETIIDYWLVAMVALAIWILFHTRNFSNLPISIAFGVACGLGLLTKWYFPFFVAPPAVYLARNHWRNAALAGTVAATIASYWYIPSGPALRTFAAINAAGGVSEGDPGRWTWQAVVFYVRLLAGYQIFFPLFLAFLAGVAVALTNRNSKWIPIWLWLLGGWLGMMLFQNKDLRYTAPLLPAVALITASIIDWKPILLALLIPLLLVQHYMVSFGLKRLPNSVVLTSGLTGPMSWDWNLYTQKYFDLWGPPAREDWKIEHVLQTVSAGNRPAKLGIVPDIPRFDSLAFEFYAHLLGKSAIIQRLATYDESAIRNNDYIVSSDTPSPFAGSFEPDRERIDKFIVSQPERFQVIEKFSLPDGQTIRLYKAQ